MDLMIIIIKIKTYHSAVKEPGLDISGARLWQVFFNNLRVWHLKWFVPSNEFEQDVKWALWLVKMIVNDEVKWEG